jgi:glycosyltransferase involved in cell wall biosynthesis
VRQTLPASLLLVTLFFPRANDQAELSKTGGGGHPRGSAMRGGSEMTAPSSSDVEFSIAVLCYRAEESVIPFIENLHTILSLFRFNWEIVLVANYWPGKSDRTPEVVRALCARLPHTRYIAMPKEGAMGWDMKSGLDACAGKYIGIIDGDGQFPVEAIFSCFAKIKSGDYDFVKTYRVLRSDSMYRNVVSSIYNWLFCLLFPAYRGLHDVNSKPKIMKREAYQRMELRARDWFIDAELVLNGLQLGLKMYEIPIKFDSLGDRKSFVRVGAILEFTRNLFSYRFGRPRLDHPRTPR